MLYLQQNSMFYDKILSQRKFIDLWWFGLVCAGKQLAVYIVFARELCNRHGRFLEQGEYRHSSLYLQPVHAVPLPPMGQRTLGWCLVGAFYYDPLSVFLLNQLEFVDDP